MLEAPHVAVGAAIASKIPNPLIAIPLAFGSHFILEKIPHWNPHLNTELKRYGHVTKKSTYLIIVDVAFALGIGFLFAYQALPNTFHFLTILAASLASVLPDLIEGPYFFMKVKNKWLMKWLEFQKSIQADTTVIPGLATQAVTIALCLYLVLLA